MRGIVAVQPDRHGMTTAGIDRSARLRVLVIAPFAASPPTNGGRIRIHEILRQLQTSNEMELVHLGDEATDTEMIDGIRSSSFVPVPRWRAMSGSLLRREPFSVARHRSRSLARHVRACGDRFDVALVEFSFMGDFATDLRIPYVLDAHNVEQVISERLVRDSTNVLYRAYARRESAAMRRFERKVWSGAASVVVTSDVDRDRILAQCPGATVLVGPNAIDAERYAEVGPIPESTRILFVGKADYRPNADAIRWLCTEIFPRVRAAVPSATLRIVGAPSDRSSGDLPQTGISFAGTVPDVVPELRQAALVVAPLRSGSGTRLKLLEAFAACRPVVTTSVGCEGLPVEHGRHALVADDADGFAIAVQSILCRPDLGRRLAANARELVEGFEWRTTADVVQRALVAATVGGRTRG